MTNVEYLVSVINKWKQGSTYSNAELQVRNYVITLINNWYQQFQRKTNNGIFVSLEIQQSGSRAKGTAIKGKSDIDLFLSFYDPKGFFTLKEIYNDIYKFLASYFKDIRKQNVSIGVKYNGCDIDIVPARKVNSSSYEKFRTRYNDHYLWSNKKQNRMLTNIQKHIDLVRYSGLLDEMILLKVWREQQKLEFPSIYMELLTIDAFSGYSVPGGNIENHFLYLLRYISDNIENKRVVDPSNSSNILSDDLTLAEKRVIKKAAQSAIDAKYWNEVVR